jgi:hypothetical protein
MRLNDKLFVMNDLLRHGIGVNSSPHTYFDKLAFRTNRYLTNQQKIFLLENANSIDIRRGHPILISDKYLLLTVGNPNERALEFLSKHPSLMVNYVEAALDLILLDDRIKLQLHDFFDNHFVQSWHGKKQTILEDNGTYTGQRRPGRWFAWYSDRHSKHTGEMHCFHIEGRHQGVVAVRNMGIKNPADLLTFDHVKYWNRHLALFDLDLTRLGRWHENQRTHRRRKKDKVEQCGRYSYHHDHAIGSFIFHIFGAHEEQDGRSLQRLIDKYGRGPFLRRLDASSIFPKPASSILFI